MAMVLSLQGCMAVGKTAAAKYLQQHAPDINISYESNADVIEQIRHRKLNKNRYGDFIEIQKLWLMNEVWRWELAQHHPCTVMDFGAEEIEFYTLKYPKSMGFDWDVETPLEVRRWKLAQHHPCTVMDFGVEEVLRKHKEMDTTRSREFFEYYLAHLLPLKREWFLGRADVDVLNVENLTADEVGQKVKEWVDCCRHNQKNSNGNNEGKIMK